MVLLGFDLPPPEPELPFEEDRAEGESDETEQPVDEDTATVAEDDLSSEVNEGEVESPGGEQN
jgi:hypothetical protein